MCGLIGVASSFITAVDMKWLKHAIIADTLRGPHSTGVALCNEEEHLTLKKAINGPAFVGMKEWEDFSRHVLTVKAPPAAVLGHNRWATVGNIDDKSAHPFTHGAITGCHNGTLWMHEHLAGGEGKGFDVDSEAVIYALDKSKNFVDVLEDLPGAFALTWHDKQTNMLHFARNDERDLYIAESKDGHTILWSSEQGMLEWLINRTYEKTGFNIYQLPIGELTSYDLDASNLAGSCKTIKFTPDDSYSMSGYGWGWKYSKGGGSSGSSNSPATPPVKRFGDAKRIKDVYGDHKGGGGLVLYKDVPFQAGQKVMATAKEYLYHSNSVTEDWGKAFMSCEHGGMRFTIGCAMHDLAYEEGAEYEVTICNNVIEYSNYKWAVIGAYGARRINDVPFETDEEEITLSNGTVSKKAWEDVKEVGCDTCGFDMSGQQPEGCSVDDGVIMCEYCTTYMENNVV